MRLVAAPAAHHAADYDQALLAGQAYLHSLGVTGWQDAIVGDYAGMGDPASTYRRAAGAASSPRTWSARCGGTAAGAPSSSTSWSRTARR